MVSYEQNRKAFRKELQEMLEIGRDLGDGVRYLLYYYGQLAITNEAGLMYWPDGPKVIIAAIHPQECAGGLSLDRKQYLLAKLNSPVPHSLRDA